MKISRPFRIILTLAGIAIICLAAWKMFAPRQPTYNGKLLSYWLSRYENRILGKAALNSSEQQEADKAVREIGTNAIPYLLKLAGRKDSALKQRMLSIYRRQSFLKLPIHDAQFYHVEASCGFVALREKAKPAVPGLIRLLKDADHQVREIAASDLGMIGPEAEEAIPAILPLLDEQNRGTPTLEAMMALGGIHRRPDIVLPRLLEFVNGDRKGWNYQSPALDAIGRYGSDAKDLAPVIITFLDDPDSSRKSSAESALIMIDPLLAHKTFSARKTH
jgi:PBS lyase HEAT-like repeat